MMRRKISQRSHADSPRRLELALGDRKKGAAENFGLIGARNDADRERAGGEAGHAEKPLAAEQVVEAGQGRRAAEIDEIDDEQLRQPAKHRRIAFANRGGDAERRRA